MKPNLFTAAASLFFALSAGAQCPTFGAFSTLGNLPTGLQPAGTLEEVSGVVASRHQPDVLWVHDDSGAGPNLVAIRTDGTLVQQYTIAGAAAIDWEDISLGPGPEPGRDYLFVGDIGDNSGTRNKVTIYRLPEPEVPAAPGPAVTLWTAEAYDFDYPGGPRNAETLLVDPVDGAPYIVSKENTTRLFRYPLPLDSAVTKTLVLEATLPPAISVATGGDITADGSLIYVRTEPSIYGFRRARGATLASAMSLSCTVFTGYQGQAESLAIEPRGQGLITIAEGPGSPILAASPTAPLRQPAWWCFGSGLPGTAGTPGLGPLRAPILDGSPVDLGVHRGRPLAPALCVLSLTALPDGVQPLAGGWLHALPDVRVPLMLAADGSGTVFLPALPPAAVLIGLQVHGQVLVDDPAAILGIALSRGLTMRFGM